MVVFRWLSFVFVVAAVMLLGADLVGTLEMKGIIIRSVYDVLALFNYDARPALVGDDLSLASSVTDSLLSWPGWLMMAFWGFVFAVIAPARRDVRPLPPPPPIPR
jgi:hypothetical protein